MFQSIKVSTAKAPDRSPVAIALYDKTKKLPSCYQPLNRECNRALAEAINRTDFSAAAGSVYCVHPPKGPRRVFIIGLGPKEKINTQIVRRGGGALVRALVKAGVGHIAPDLAGVGKAVDADLTARAFGEGVAIGNLTFDTYHGAVKKQAGGDDKQAGAKKLAIHAATADRKAIARGLQTGVSANVARELAATPPNVANPKYIAEFCKKMARQVGLTCKVIDHRKAAELGMEGLINVGKAGSTPPAMICLEWNGGGSAAAKKKAPTLLVGKAITFDTGGYSLKVGGTMLGMKYDKCGGMAVIGAMHAAATLKLPGRIVGIIAAAENMVDSVAYRPDDILKMYNGVTVEVTNTDAEGRLVLADALAYGCKTYKPDRVIDLATLTGGVVVALGAHCAGVFVNDEPLRTTLMDAAETSGERLWRLPLWDEHREQMKGTHSDIVNSSSTRGAHPIQGAAFLSYFAVPGGDAAKIGEIPWAHIDIAGVADVETDSELYDKGPTGYGVRLLVHALEG